MTQETEALIASDEDLTKLFAGKPTQYRKSKSLPKFTGEAMRACAKMEAVIPEPASAATIAAAVKLHEDGVTGDDDRVVCVLTGSGLRDLKLFNNENADIPSVKPGDMDSLKQAVEHYQK